MSSKRYQGRIIKILSLVVLILSGCNTKTPEDQVRQAALYHSQGSTEIAIIELKNILQKTPQMDSALSLLNEIYTKEKQYTDIVSLLSSLANEGLSNQKLLYSLVDALIQKAQFDEAIDVVNQYSEKFKTAQGFALTGHCFAGLNNIKKAKEYYQQALLIDNDLISAQLGLAQEAIILAKKQKQKNLQEQDQNPDDWVVRRQTVVTEKENNLEEAKKYLQRVLKKDPDNITGNYLTATIYYSEKDIIEAQRYINRVLITDANHKESLLLMGKLHLELSHLNKGKEFLEKYLKIVPDDLKARMYVASIMIRQDQPDMALTLLENFSQKGKQDPEYLLIMGNAHLAKNNNDLAVDYFEQAHAIYPSSTLVKMYASMGYLARNNSNKKDRGTAIKLLEEVLFVEPENKQASISLVTSLLQENNYKKAQKVAENLIKELPKAPIPYYLSGLAWLGMENSDNAILSFKRTLVFDHSFLPATIRLAKIYFKKGNYVLAKNQYEEALFSSPYNSEILTEMAVLEQKVGNNDKAIDILELARDRNPEALSPRLLLGNYYLRRGRINVAQQVLDELNRLAPDRLDIQMFFGQVQLASGRTSEAVSIFSKLIAIEPEAPGLLIKYARALRRNGQLEESREALETAQSLTVETIPEILFELGKVELSVKNYSKLDTIINNLQTEFSGLPEGYILEGDLAMLQKKYQAAVLPYKQALDKSETTLIVLKLYEAYSKSGMGDKALTLLDNAVNKKSDDLRLGISLASAKRKSGDSKSAIEIYQRLLIDHPENALILNNLAWVYETTDRQKALSFAERAYKMTPEIPQVIDSYGWFCILEGRIKKGLSLLKIAVKKAPADPEFHYHLAEALIKSGEKVSAIKSLEIALGSQESFNGRSNAEELLIKLGRENPSRSDL